MNRIFIVLANSPLQIETEKNKINYNSWGIDCVGKFGGEEKEEKLRIPWNNISIVREAIS